MKRRTDKRHTGKFDTETFVKYTPSSRDALSFRKSEVWNERESTRTDPYAEVKGRLRERRPVDSGTSQGGIPEDIRKGEAFDGMADLKTSWGKGMTARELLESYGPLVRELDALHRELDLCLRNRDNDSLDPEHWDRNVRVLEGKVEAKSKEERACRMRIDHALIQLQNKSERQLLTLRFVDLLSHEEISEVTSFCKRHIFRTQRNAIERMQEIMNYE